MRANVRPGQITWDILQVPRNPNSQIQNQKVNVCEEHLTEYIEKKN